MNAVPDPQGPAETHPADNPPPKPVSPWVEAFRALSHITTAISVMLAAGGLGYGLDFWLGTTFFTLIGTAGGGYLGIRHLINVTG